MEQPVSPEIPLPQPPTPVPPRSHSNKNKLIFLISLILLLISISSVLYYLGQNSTQTPTLPSSFPLASPAPSPDETSGWKTYSSSQFGYSVNYPFNWEAVESTREELIRDEIHKTTLLEKEYEFWQGTFQISILENPESLSLDAWVSQLRIESASGANLIQKVEDIELDGNPAKKLDILAFDHDDIVVITVQNNFIFYLQFEDADNPNDPGTEKHQEIYNQILSSFEFVDSDETSGWKTYRNEEYGFEFKYPLDYQLIAEPNPISPETVIASPGDLSNLVISSYTSVRQVQGEERNAKLTKGSKILFAGRSAREYREELQEEFTNVFVRDIQIDDTNGLPNWSQPNEISYWVDKSKPDQIDIFDQILSTFEFIDNKNVKFEIFQSFIGSHQSGDNYYIHVINIDNKNIVPKTIELIKDKRLVAGPFNLSLEENFGLCSHLAWTGGDFYQTAAIESSKWPEDYRNISTDLTYRIRYLTPEGSESHLDTNEPPGVCESASE